MAEPDRYQFADGDIEINANRRKKKFTVTNTGDRAVQVGSHFHLFEANRALKFDRVGALGMHLDLPAGTAIRFEPGDTHEVEACDYGGLGYIAGFSGLVNGSIRARTNREAAISKMRELGFLEDDGSTGTKKASTAKRASTAKKTSTAKKASKKKKGGQ